LFLGDVVIDTGIDCSLHWSDARTYLSVFAKCENIKKKQQHSTDIVSFADS
jgi:hypothetical protein